MASARTMADFKDRIRRGYPKDLAESHVRSATVRALPTAVAYDAFKVRALDLFPLAEAVFIAGSGNWGYSLNPRKLWEPYRKESDVDVALVSEQMFRETWDELRRVHREHWHRLGYNVQQVLRRNGENVYCGFASPLWIPITGHPHSYAFRRAANSLSTKEIDWRTVSLMIFRNEVEAVDYYQRGFHGARRSLKA